MVWINAKGAFESISVLAVKRRGELPLAIEKNVRKIAEVKGRIRRRIATLAGAGFGRRT